MSSGLGVFYGVIWLSMIIACIGLDSFLPLLAAFVISGVIETLLNKGR